MQNREYHLENRFGDNRIKTVGVCKTVDIIRKTDVVTNRIKAVGANRAPVTVIKTLGMYIP